MCHSHKLIFVTGAPGSGKTYHIRNALELCELPRIDIKEMYEKSPEACQFDGWKIAQDMLIDAAIEWSDQLQSDVVCEAILLKGTPSRARLIEELKKRGVSNTFIDLHEDYETCQQRVITDFANFMNSGPCEEDIEPARTYFNKRMDILRSYHEKGLV